MFYSKDKTQAIREFEFAIYCISIQIWQDMDDGLRMRGHGVIKQNKMGLLYVDFVCVNFSPTQNSSLHRSLTRRVPENYLDEKQKVFAEFEDLEGRKFTSEGLSFKYNELWFGSNIVFQIPLTFIQLNEPRFGGEKSTSFLLYEFCETVNIPKNKLNTTQSTKGSSISGWDETVINHDGFNLSIRSENGYSLVKAEGEFETSQMIECVNFFLGFSCGIRPQPYIVFESVGSKSTSKVKSFNPLDKNRHSSNPIPSHVSIPEGEDKEYSSNLFKQIWELRKNKPKIFASLQSQWERVWHGFSSTDEIAVLVLSVAIEGILNDVYCPVFKQTRVAPALIDDMRNIKTLIKGLDIDNRYKDRLQNSVSYWKNVTAARALEILIEEGVLNYSDKKIWGEVRNAAAHPKKEELNNDAQIEVESKFYHCLNLFNKLVLNVVGYSGPLVIFDLLEDPAIQTTTYKQVL